MKQSQTVKIYTLAFGGDGIGKLDGKVCFVEGALPGEDVTFNVIKETSSFIKGSVASIDTSSEDRIQPECEHFGNCGGCQLQHITYEKELYYKEQQVEELIKRISGIKDFELESIVASNKPYGYRDVIRLHRGKDERVGFFGKRSRSVVTIKNCPVSARSINDKLSSIACGKKNNEIVLKSDNNGNVWMSGSKQERFFLDRYNDVELFLSPDAFSQVNRYIAVNIAEVLEGLIGKDNKNVAFFDVYCGAGFFSFLLKNDLDTFIGIDENKVAIECAKKTLAKGTSINKKFYRGIVEKMFIDVYKRHKRDKNILLLNPPRTGVQKSFLETLKDLDGINKIYYLSCDPARLARDIKILTQPGKLHLKKIIPFDMFPQTKHIETLAELST